MDDLKSRLAALPPEQRELLLRQLKQKREAQRQEIQSYPRDGRTFPLTFSQERMWFLHQLDPASPLYNVSITTRLHGTVDGALLQETLNRLAARHEAFRTTFALIDGQPQQRIAAEGALPLQRTDLRAEQEPEECFYELARQDLVTPFDLEQGPLARVHLYRLTDAEARLTLIMHHVVSDGWSLGVLTQELSTIYTALLRSETPALPPLPVQCADFAIWQRQWLQGETLASLQRYWEQQLADAPQHLSLPTSRPQPQEYSLRGDRIPFQLDNTLSHSLKEGAQQGGPTRFMVLLAGFAALLARLTGQEELVIGTPISNRTQAESAGVVGVFVNTLALRIDLSGNPTCQTLIERVRKVVLEGLEYQAMPFAKLVDLLKLERRVNRSPLFQVSFGLQENPLKTMRLPGLDVELLEIHSLLTTQTLPPLHTGMSMFDLTFHLSEIEEGVGGWIEYSTDLFDAAAVERIAAQYKAVLAAMAANPAQRLSQLPLLSPEERAALAAWNATAHPWPDRATSLHGLFERQAQETPDAIAVREVGGRELTFQQLEARANRLAHYLRQQGVGIESRVGVSLASGSLDMVVAILGILKAGGAYVPLPPDYPPARLTYMMDNADLRLLLTQEALASSLPPVDCPLLCLDRDWAEIEAQPSTAPRLAVDPGAMAYLIYTSGSTNHPKGVMVAHRSACNLVRAQIEAFALEPGCRVLQFASFSFDASVSEIFTTLVSGATLLLASREQRLPGEALVALLNAEEISTITLPPSALMLMDPAQVPTLRTLVSAGEACSWDIAERWSEGRRLLNFYGPTEATVGCCYHLVEGFLPGPASVPIGKPIPNARLYVVDEQLQPVPFGVAGELLVGGETLARGYLQQPAMTAEKFIPDPFGSEAGARLYRTGDRVRLWPGGYLEFLGRIDRQVKLRGYRIEVGEIESQLRRHPSIRDAVVLLREEGERKYLVAYLIAAPDSAPELLALRQFLAEHLPDYMIPAHFVPLERWPLTSRGKIDHRALPDPSTQRLQVERDQAEPRDEIEEKLLAIWQGLLGVEPINLHDSFFELGGDSIMSIQMVTRAREAGIHLSPQQVFKHQSIAELAKLARQGPDAGTLAEQSPVIGEVALSPIQRWFFEQPLAQRHHWNQAIFLTLPERPLLSVLREAVEHLLTHHDALRLRFREQDGAWAQQCVAPGGESPLTYVNLQAVPPAERESTIEVEATRAHATLNLEEGPLFRVVYFDAGESEPARLLLLAHHLVVDAISWRILAEDLQSAYQQLRDQQLVHLPAKSTSFRQWTALLEAYAQTEEVRAHLAYWQEGQEALTAPLPLDFPVGLEQNSEQSRRLCTATLPADLTRLLLQEGPRAYNMRPHELLLTALALLWRQWTGSETLWVALEGHGREAISEKVDLTRSVGWFTTLFPARLALGATVELAPLLMSVKEQLRAIPLNGLSYGLLRYLRQDDAAAALRDLPAPPISFNYLGHLVTEPQAAVHTRDVGPTRAAENLSPTPFAVEAQLIDQQLMIEWHYSAALHRPESAQWLVDNYAIWLRTLIEHCQAPEAGGYTPSDFPEAGLDQAGLDSVLSELFD